MMSCCGGNNTRATEVIEQEVPHGAEQTELKIQGMSCGACVAAVERALAGIPGVYHARVSVGSAVVRYDPNRVSEDDLAQAIQSAGYTVGTSTAEAQSSGCC
jgi:copper chaperone